MASGCCWSLKTMVSKDRQAHVGNLSAAAKGWVPKDAELEDDKGAELKWIATDFERRDDVGIPSDISKVVTCKSFPLGSYEFPEIKAAGGDLKVSQK